MATTPVFFQKELPEQPIFIQGKGFRFEFLETQDDFLIGELRNAVRGGFGGVIEITKEAFDDGVKKKRESGSQPSFQRKAELQPQWSQPPNARPAVVLGNRQPPANLPPAEPINVPSPKIFLPKVGKL